ncbi:MAG: hypothetical protein KZQ92_00440 [Candidatus Thiodiazotropha sp. (ex Lucinoma borealis)]|nr:hypothetical protein [Candidatus Thiodiazotropha sp. (ex Lucinoma borealis)]
MSLYDQIAKGFNPLQGLESAANVNLKGAQLKHEFEKAARKDEIAADDRQNKLNQKAFENSIKVQKLVASMDEKQRERFRESVEDMVKLGDFVESQPDPQAAYRGALPHIKKLYPDADLPAEYDPESMAQLRALATPIDKLFQGETYGAPVKGLDSDGNPAFFQSNREGDIKPVEGYVPLSQKLGMSKLTGAQEARNLTIDQARRALKSRNLDQAKIRAATQQYTDTGRSNQDYDPQLSGLLKAALTRKVGDDPEFEKLYGQFYGNQTAPNQEVEATAPLAGARQAPDGYWYIPDPDRPGGFLQVVE